MFTVSVGRVPGEIKTYSVESPATVADALSAASITVSSGENIVLNGTPADTETELQDRATVLLTRQVKGNRF